MCVSHARVTVLGRMSGMFARMFPPPSTVAYNWRLLFLLLPSPLTPPKKLHRRLQWRPSLRYPMPRRSPSSAPPSPVSARSGVNFLVSYVFFFRAFGSEDDFYGNVDQIWHIFPAKMRRLDSSISSPATSGVMWTFFFLMCWCWMIDLVRSRGFFFFLLNLYVVYLRNWESRKHCDAKGGRNIKYAMDVCFWLMISICVPYFDLFCDVI